MNRTLFTARAVCCAAIATVGLIGAPAAAPVVVDATVSPAAVIEAAQRQPQVVQRPRARIEEGAAVHHAECDRAVHGRRAAVSASATSNARPASATA